MKSILSLIGMSAALGINPMSFAMGAVRRTPEPRQTEEQKQWYLNRARERREKRAAKKRINQTKTELGKLRFHP